MSTYALCSADVGWIRFVLKLGFRGMCRLQGVALMVHIVESLRDKYNILPWSSLSDQIMNILVHVILLHHGHHFWLEQTTLHTQEVNILLVRIFLLYLVRRLSDVKCHPHPSPPSLLNYILGNSSNKWGNNLMQFLCSTGQWCKIVFGNIFGKFLNFRGLLCHKSSCI